MRCVAEVAEASQPFQPHHQGGSNSERLGTPRLQTPARDNIERMSSARYVHWQDGEMWLGYFEDFPDYWTQGQTLEELEDNLRDLYRDLTGGEIPGIRRVAELSVG